MNNKLNKNTIYSPAPDNIQKKANQICDAMIDVKFEKNLQGSCRLFDHFLKWGKKEKYKEYIKKIYKTTRVHRAGKKYFIKINENNTKTNIIAFTNITGIFYPEKISLFTLAHEVAHAIEPYELCYKKDYYYREYRAQKLAIYTLIKLKKYNEIIKYKYKELYHINTPYFMGFHDTLQELKIEDCNNKNENKDFFKYFEKNKKTISKKYGKFLIFLEINKLLHNKKFSKYKFSIKDRNKFKTIYKQLQDSPKNKLSPFIKIYKSTEYYKDTLDYNQWLDININGTFS